MPVKIDYLDQISTSRDLYQESVGNLAYSLGKEAFDHAMGLILAATFSQSSIFTTGNSDKDMLDNIAGDLNGIGAAPIGRFGIVNTAVFAALEADSKIASGDYHGTNAARSRPWAPTERGGI